MRVLTIPDHQEGWPFIGGILGGLTVGGEGPTPLQRDVVTAIVRRFRGPEFSLDDVEPLSAEETVTAITDPELRLELVNALVALELMEHPLPEAVEHNVRHYADALGVSPASLETARDVAHHHAMLLHADILRNSWYTKETIDGFGEGLGLELTRSKLAYFGGPEDHELAAKWEALANCPPGSWGRRVADFYEAHHFPFPGERHGIYEIGALHDFVHVLADYSATPEGEIDVFAFITTTMTDPSRTVLFLVTLCLFQNASIKRVGGKEITIARADTLSDEGATDHFADAVFRGEQCNVDVMAGIDHFALASEPLDEIRERFDIPGKLTPGPGAIPDPHDQT